MHLVFYITELHKIQVRSQLNFSKSPKQNEHQFYKIKSGITECLKNQVKLFLSKSQLCISDAQASNHLFNVAPNVKRCAFCPVLSLSEAGALWLLYLKTRGGSQGLYILSFSGAKPTNRAINLIAFVFT